MSAKQESSEVDETSKKELVEEIKEMNRRWYEKRWLFVLSLILGSTTFIAGFFLDLEATWQSALQSAFFLLSAGFFVLVLSYIFNVTWLYVIKKKSDREIKLSFLLQITSILAFIPNIVLMGLRFTSRFIITDVRGVYYYTYYKSNYSTLMNVNIIWSHYFSGKEFWFNYNLGKEHAQVFIILIVVYAVISAILGITAFFTIKKIKRPFVVKDHLKYLLDLFLIFYYGVIVLVLLIKNLVSAEKINIKKSPQLKKFKETVIFILIPILFVAMFFAMYLLTNYSFEFLFDTPWPLFF